MDLLVVVEVAAFCPWDEEDLAELGGIGEWLPPQKRRVRDWCAVAEASASAVDQGLGDESVGEQEWLDSARNFGLRGPNLAGFASLRCYPIAVSPSQWTNGRHRGWLIQRAGARRTAVLNPDWSHPSWREPGGGSPCE